MHIPEMIIWPQPTRQMDIQPMNQKEAEEKIKSDQKKDVFLCVAKSIDVKINYQNSESKIDILRINHREKKRNSSSKIQRKKM